MTLLSNMQRGDSWNPDGESFSKPMTMQERDAMHAYNEAARRGQKPPRWAMKVLDRALRVARKGMA